MGFFPSPIPTSREIPQVRQEFDNPSIISSIFSPRELGIFSLFRGNTFCFKSRVGF